MKKRTIFISATLGLILCLLGVGTNIAMAQSSSDNNGHGQALEIAPPLITLSVDPGQIVTTKINIRNISGGNLIVSGQINDFVAAGEDGTPKLLTEETKLTNNPYSIVSWVSPMPELNLATNQMKALPVTIIVPKDASPGGHYGVVRFTGTPPDLEGTGMSLSASLGSLIMLRVSGDVKEEMSLTDFYVSQNGNKGWFFETAPLVINQKITNSGNVHEQPMGTVTIADMFGNKLATLGVNKVTPPGNVLPDSTRLFTENLDKSVIGNKMLFGRYTAELSVKYGDKNETITKTITFWVIPYKLIVAIIIILIALFFIMRFAIQNYNKRIIAKANGTHQKSKSKSKSKK